MLQDRQPNKPPPILSLILSIHNLHNLLLYFPLFKLTYNDIIFILLIFSFVFYQLPPKYNNKTYSNKHSIKFGEKKSHSQKQATFRRIDIGKPKWLIHITEKTACRFIIHKELLRSAIFFQLYTQNNTINDFYYNSRNAKTNLSNFTAWFLNGNNNERKLERKIITIDK